MIKNVDNYRVVEQSKMSSQMSVISKRFDNMVGAQQQFETQMKAQEEIIMKLNKSLLQQNAELYKWQEKYIDGLEGFKMDNANRITNMT